MFVNDGGSLDKQYTGRYTSHRESKVLRIPDEFTPESIQRKKKAYY